MKILSKALFPCVLVMLIFSIFCGCATEQILKTSRPEVMTISSNIPETKVYYREQSIRHLPDQGWKFAGEGDQIDLLLYSGGRYEIKAKPKGYAAKTQLFHEPLKFYAFTFYEADMIQTSSAAPVLGDSPLFFADDNAGTPVTNMSRPDAVAVVIGNSNYTHRDIPVVSFAHHDAYTIKSYLIKTLGFDERNIIFDTDITKARFEALFGIRGNPDGRLADFIKPGISDVFIYYSGHGAPDPNDSKGYFLPVDCDPDKIALNGYSLDLFYENLSKIEAHSVTVVLEACFSGGTSTGEMIVKSASPVMLQVKEPDTSRSNTTVIASSQYDQISSWYNEKSHGLFTYFFLKALSGDGDLNGDGHITLAEIHEYVDSRTSGVPYWARRLHGREQRPVLFGSMPDQILVSFD